MFAYLLRFRFLQARRYFKNRRLAKAITALIFLAVIFLVAVGIYVFFRWEFRLTSADQYLKSALPLYLFEWLFFVVFALVAASAFVTGLFTLFRGENDGWLIASPKFKTVFWSAYARIFLSSVWPLLIVALPAFLGFRASYNIGLAGIALGLLAMVFLVGFAVSLAVFIVMLCAYILSVPSKKNFLTIGRVALLVALIFVAFVFFAWQRIGTADILKLFAPVSPSWNFSRTDVILGQFRIFPSHLVALTLFALQNNLVGEAFLAVIQLGVMFILGFLLVWISSLTYLELWQILREGHLQAKTAVRGVRTGPVRFPRYLKSPLGAFFEKEALVNFRELRNVLWFGFLFFLWLVQVAAGFFIRRNMVHYGTSQLASVALLEALEIVVAVYFASAFVLRFAFPSFSTERKTAWIFGSAPLKLEKVFLAKLLFYGAVFMAMGLAVGAANSFIIGVPLADAVLFLFFVALAIAFVTTFGLCMGTVYPNFDTDDPEVLSTSLAGLGFIFGSLIYGGAGSLAFYVFLAGGGPLGLVAFGILSVLGIAVLLDWAFRSLRTFEFVKEISAG